MLKVPHEIQLHVTHSCNLTCEGCTHYSNHGHSGMLSLDLAEEWMHNWSNKIIPTRFTILGGEPTLHKDLPKFINLIGVYWKNSHKELITNGFYLKNHPDLVKELIKTNTTLAVSIHHNCLDYIKKFKPVYDLLLDWHDQGVNIEMRTSIKHWLRQYKNFGDQIEPYEDNDPKSSWNACISKMCVQLHDGKLWKCPGLAYLPMQKEKYNLSEKWDPYLKYQPLEPNCSEDDLWSFFVKKSESYCKMCPAKEEHFEPENPLLPLSYWKHIYKK